VKTHIPAPSFSLPIFLNCSLPGRSALSSSPSYARPATTLPPRSGPPTGGSRPPHGDGRGAGNGSSGSIRGGYGRGSRGRGSGAGYGVGVGCGAGPHGAGHFPSGQFGGQFGGPGFAASPDAGADASM
jgi:hypothetical protein